MDTVSALSAYLPHVSYLGVFLLLFVFDSFIPVPEEVVLLFVGYISGLGGISIVWTLPLALAGVALGDFMNFFLIKTGSSFIRRFLPTPNKHTIERYQGKMHRRLGTTIIVLRFVAAFRYISPIVATSLGVSYTQYMIYNSLALVVYVPLYTLLGYAFHTQLAVLISDVNASRHVVFFIALLLIGILLTLPMRKHVSQDKP